MMQFSARERELIESDEVLEQHDPHRRAPGKRSRVARDYYNTPRKRAANTTTPSLNDVAASANTQVPHRAEMESSFNTSFGEVGVVLGGKQARAALHASDANAAAMGNSIVFADTKPSRELVAHELAHTIQQGAIQAPRGNASVSSTEAEAHMIGAQVAAGGQVNVSGRAPARVAQFDARSGAERLRDMAREQHEARGIDSPEGGSGGAHGSFNDMDEEDTGPAISHDHGHLDDGHGNIDESLRRDPTWADRLQLIRWIAQIEAAELLRPDLVDGTSAYRHFLNGNGATRDIDYARFVEGDSSGATVLQSAVEDTRQAAIERHDQDLAGTEPTEGTQTYHIRTDPVSVTSGDARYPYPATENWQKAIGAHPIWIEATVTVTVRRVSGASNTPAPAPGASPAPAPSSTPSSTPARSSAAPAAPDPDGETAAPAAPAAAVFERHFDIAMTIHAEDMYNFNRGAVDIATGTPDSANGLFEITGLGHEYLNQGTYNHSFEFDANMDAAASPTSTAGPNDPGRSSRSGRPSDRRAYPTTR